MLSEGSQTQKKTCYIDSNYIYEPLKKKNLIWKADQWLPGARSQGGRDGLRKKRCREALG